jgi:hypothetical protein
VRSKREVRYIVSRLENPEDPDGERNVIGWYGFLDLAKREADRLAPGTCVDAEGGTYTFDGGYSRRSGWQADWINLNVHMGRQKRQRQHEIVTDSRDLL